MLYLPTYLSTQKMIDTEGDEGGEMLDEPMVPLVNLSTIMPTEIMIDGGDENSQGRVKDGLLEAFLQSNFPDEDVQVLPESDWQTLRSDVFGKTAGGAFKVGR